MNVIKNIEEQFKILKKIDSNPAVTQRKLAKYLGYSLGKLNYCLKALNQKGLIKIKNVYNNPNKIKYLYILTPNGIKIKMKLAINLMAKKMKEYDELKLDIKKN